MKTVLVFAGNYAEASAWAKANGASNYTVLTTAYHLRNFERRTPVYLVGTWDKHPELRRFESEARTRECPLIMGSQYKPN